MSSISRPGGEWWDVIVVGGGPAGSATAGRLARGGHRVLLLDRADFPRSKPCGECLNPAAVAALDRLGALSAVLAAEPARLQGWRIHASGGTAFDGLFPPERPGLALPRATLDALLLAHARALGAEVRTGVRVIDLLWKDGRVIGVRIAGFGETELWARLVVGADGLRSVVVRRLMLLRRRPRLRKIALAAHVRGLDLGGTGELHAFPWGCIGVAEVGDGSANLTLVLNGDEAEGIGGDRAGFFDQTLRQLPRFAPTRRIDAVLATGPFDWPTRRIVADGALLVGDAAGYYDPFTGQGIFRALRGAELAAETADRALQADTLSAAALAPYERAHQRAFRSGVRLQHLIEAVVSRPRLLNATARTLQRRSTLANALVAVTGDLAPVRSLLQL